MHPLKPKYTSLKCTRSYIKHSGFKRHLRRKYKLKLHEGEVCNKLFKCELLMDFHKLLHHQPPAVKDKRFRTGINFI